jgi:NAD+ diphosphatase
MHVGGRPLKGFVSSLNPAGPVERARWFPCVDGDLLVVDTGRRVDVPEAASPAELGSSSEAAVYLGTLDGEHCYAVRVDPDHAPHGLTRVGLRGLHGRLEDRLFALAGRAVQLLEWDRTHRFCGVCGSPTERMTDERARRCPTCGHLHFPRISPVVIVRIDRGHETLLAHARGFPEGMYSTLAGFVEPGEALEEAVAREVREEVGVDVADLRYFASQSWPFPHSLMIAFTARYQGGEVDPDGVEIEGADWFEAEALPLIPPPMSIARWMIDAFVRERSD